MGPIPPRGGCLIDQAHIGLVDESGGAEGVIWPLPPQAAMGDPPQVVIDQRQQLVEGASVTAGALRQQSRYIGRYGL